MKYLSNIIKNMQVTHFYSSEPYGEKVANYLHINNRIVDKERNVVPISARKIRQDLNANSNFVEGFVYKEFKKESE